jgi:hypothetical protein
MVHPGGKTLNTPIPDFKFEETGKEQRPNTVHSFAAADLAVVGYTDGDGRQQTRLCAVIPGKKGGHKVFIFQERIQGVNVATPSHAWFEKAITALLENKGGVKSV